MKSVKVGLSTALLMLLAACSLSETPRLESQSTEPTLTCNETSSSVTCTVDAPSPFTTAWAAVNGDILSNANEHAYIACTGQGIVSVSAKVTYRQRTATLLSRNTCGSGGWR